MKSKTSFMVWVLIFLAYGWCLAEPSTKLESARETLLVSSMPAQIILKYSRTAKKTSDPKIIAEYAYALAFCGLPEASIYNIDRALIAAPLDADVRFYLSEILNAFGLEKASDEIASAAPAWLKQPLNLPKLELSVPVGDFEKSLAEINLLMAQKRYAQSIVMFDRVCRIAPDKSLCHAGYAIALEKIGAYKTSAIEAKKDLELSESAEHKKTASAYIAELENRPRLKYPEMSKARFKGRYLAHLGGSLNRNSQGTLYSFRGRAGKFITDRLDISANIALDGGNSDSDYNGLAIGAGLRYNAPVKFAPFNATFGAKIERVPGPDDNLIFFVSPGASYFMKESSIDLFVDFALSGPYNGSNTISLGYTVYFGKIK
ncbi:MAG: hypothetical protein HY746_02715 [Elusimicrobia bacterium]|nr:hypothetical protein [Elusimicrobiota bacterium]